MATKALLNYLGLAFAPISNYDFVELKKYRSLDQWFNQAHIYIIAQRPVIYIDDLIVGEIQDGAAYVNFKIKKKGANVSLQCGLSLEQNNLCRPLDPKITFKTNFIFPKPDPLPRRQPFDGVANFVICCSTKEVYWFSPERFLYEYWNGFLEADIDGDVHEFLDYNLLYIGKATEQDILKRLTGHASLQHILSVEQPFHYGSLPTDEIVLLLYKLNGGVHVHVYDDKDADDDQGMIDMAMGVTDITDKDIYLDAEKALINALQPKHNQTLYPSYPKSKDGLHRYRLDGYSYSFSDPVKLLYKDGYIQGHPNENQADSLLIKNDQLEILRSKKT